MKECCKTYLEGQFGGDAALVQEIYAEYAASMREKLAEAKAALSAGDWGALDRAAHTMKGNALMSGDNVMADIAIALRSEAKLQNKEAAAAKIGELEREAGFL